MPKKIYKISPKLSWTTASDEIKAMRQALSGSFSSWSAFTPLDSLALAQVLHRRGITPRQVRSMVDRGEIGQYLLDLRAKV